ncbi:MAG: hypothetical protein IRZ16_01210 [Myxococcaceae bacterium]|nr:hypothetical protein [Myxococcaceae bacterium]
MQPAPSGARAPAPVISRRVLTCASEAAALWDVVADTDRLNRALGMAPLELEPVNGPGPARYRVRTRVVGLAVEYYEEPFEFDEPRRFALRRIPTSGPYSLLEVRTQLTPLDAGGTRAEMEIAVYPRTRLAAPVAALQARTFLARWSRLVREADGRLVRRESPVVVGPPPVILEPAFSRAASQLEPVTPKGRDAAEALVKWLRSAPDPDVLKIRPYAVADEWGLDRAAVLDACLAAVPAGLLELNWELVCPSCRTGADTVATLSALPGSGHCHLCDLSFGLESEQALEAVLRPVKAARAIPEMPFCIGGPRRTPHVVAQRILSREGTLDLTLPAVPGRYRLFVRGGGLSHLELAADGPASIEVHAHDAELSPTRLTARPGGTLTVRFRQTEDRQLKLERSEWANAAVTLRDLSLHPTFRRGFGLQLLRQGQSLKIGRTALMFTDLTGSTALYAAMGDAAAFDMVDAHFVYLRERIERHGGVVVKTIGDAVFAAFGADEDAVVCAADALRDWEQFQAEVPAAKGVFLKLGIHSGPTYVITANGQLDYFGQSVNIAARLQGLAGANELVVSGDVALPDLVGFHRQPFTAEVKGVPGALSLHRITPMKTSEVAPVAAGSR